MRTWVLVLGIPLGLCGCTTAPQADFMDTFFKSRNACCDPMTATMPTGVPAPAGTVIVPGAPPQGVVMELPAEEEQRQGHPWFRRRNRNLAPAPR